ncbi:MAG TPA: peptidoglycan-binding domain-containing protein [Verrucomicrobiae bacterium]|nr:peptidoglycan-binding domain-containing protein [Verrucomicrobiae bacterium]
MKWLNISASVALALAVLAGPASSARAGQSDAATSSSSTSAKPSSSKRSTHKRKHSSRRQPGQKAPTTDRISEIQSALARGGYYRGDPSGKFDGNTVVALEKFQSANGLDANGKLDAPTLQKLGLGSDIAGVAAPKPVVPSCCSMAAPTAATPTLCCSTAAPAAPSPSGGGAEKAATTGPLASDPKPAQP